MTYSLIQEFTGYCDEDRDFLFYQVKERNNNCCSHPFLSALVADASAQETESKTFSEKKIQRFSSLISAGIIFFSERQIAPRFINARVFKKRLIDDNTVDDLRRIFAAHF